MSDLNLENIVGFKAVDKDGNEQNVTVDEMVDMVSTRMVMALSETSTFAAAAATGNDVYENELPTVTDAANVRVLQSSGDAAQMTMQSLASKLGGLIGIEKVKKTVTATLEGSIIYSGDIGFNSYIVSCNNGGMPFNLTIISNSGNMRYSIINGAIRQGYSIYVDGDKKQYLKIKRDETVNDQEFNFTLFKVV